MLLFLYIFFFCRSFLTLVTSLVFTSYSYYSLIISQLLLIQFLDHFKRKMCSNKEEFEIFVCRINFSFSSLLSFISYFSFSFFFFFPLFPRLSYGEVPRSCSRSRCSDSRWCDEAAARYRHCYWRYYLAEVR